MSKTTVILILAVISLGLYDIYAAWRFGITGTISYVIYHDSKSYPIIAFAMGVICGHLFWAQSD
jgi:hypothetical protein